MGEIKYPAARSHKFLHAAPQCRPIKRGARRKALIRKYESKDGKQQLEIRLFSELDIADQDLLICLCSMVLPNSNGVIVGNNPSHQKNIDLRDDLDLKGNEVTRMNALSCETTAFEILTELNKGRSKRAYDWLLESFKRLAGVQFYFKNSSGINQFNLISWSMCTNKNGRIESIDFCLNPYSAGAVLGSGGYVLQHRGERSLLKKEESRALHSVLCGMVDMGSEHTFNVDMLADKVYSRYDEDVTQKAIELRRKSIINSCDEINELAYWSCESLGRGKRASLSIRRKRRKDI